MSALLPRPTIAATPSFVERANPRMPIPMPPDCDASAAWPRTSYGVVNAALIFCGR